MTGVRPRRPARRFCQIEFGLQGLRVSLDAATLQTLYMAVTVMLAAANQLRWAWTDPSPLTDLNFNAPLPGRPEGQ